MCVSSREAMEFRYAQCGCKLAKVLKPVVHLLGKVGCGRLCPLGAFATCAVLGWHPYLLGLYSPNPEVRDPVSAWSLGLGGS